MAVGAVLISRSSPQITPRSSSADAAFSRPNSGGKIAGNGDLIAAVAVAAA
jgi:hypothetical protein